MRLLVPSSVPVVIGPEPRVPEGRGLFARVDIPPYGLVVCAHCSCSACAGTAFCTQFGVYSIPAYSPLRGYPAPPMLAMTGLFQLANHDREDANAEMRSFQHYGTVIRAMALGIRAGMQVLTDYGALYKTSKFAPLGPSAPKKR